MTVKVAFLGGLGEVGRNCASLEVDGKLALIDCGLMFPEEDMLGVDLVLPDFTSLLERAADVECVILTHGHEDHVGALAYFLRELPVPVYGTRLAVELARGRVEELGVEARFEAVEDNEWRRHGPFEFMMIPVSHSIPQGAAVAFDTPEGIVLHSGDFKLDPTPVDGRPTDLPAFAALAGRGIRLLLSDSTNAERPGFVPSESSLAGPLYDIIAEAPGRVIAACFASHLHRVQQIADAGLDDGRTIAFLGRSMQRNVAIGSDLGLLHIPAERVVDIEDLSDVSPRESMVVCTGSQGEPFAALSLMASGEHRFVKLADRDTVLISATPIPGNETRVSRVINGLLKRGARVYHGRNATVHVSGHAARDELATFLNLIRPDVLVPVHGEYRHLRAHAAIAADVGVPEVLVCEDGDVVVLDGDETSVERRAVPAGYVYLDGLGIGDVERSVLRDRRHLADEGVVVVTVGLDVHSGEVVHGPELFAHGLADDPTAILDRAAHAIITEIERHDLRSQDEVRRRVFETARRVIREETARRPVILPVIIEF